MEVWLVYRWIDEDVMEEVEVNRKGEKEEGDGLGLYDRIATRLERGETRVSCRIFPSCVFVVGLSEKKQRYVGIVVFTVSHPNSYLGTS
jgi:hypothetical protein